MADRAKRKESKKEKKQKDKGEKPKLGLVFGRRLEEVIESQNNGNFVPNIVRETITWLEANGAVNEEGLFRVPGQMTIIENLKKEYDTKGTASLDGITDVASVAGLLKLYLRELPEPLLVYRFYSTFVKIAKNPDPEARLRNLRILVNGLPEANKSTVYYLLEFLAKVVHNEKVNRMSAANLAMIFSPNLLRTEKEELSQIMMEAGYLTSVVKMMIEEIDYLTNKSDKPATLKSSGSDVIAKPELVPIAEMQRRLTGSMIVRPDAAILATRSPSGTQSDSIKLEGDESGSGISASEQKRKELEDIKQKLKEKEELLKHLEEQLDEDDGEGSENEDEEEGLASKGSRKKRQEGAVSDTTEDEKTSDHEGKADQASTSDSIEAVQVGSKITSALQLDEFGV